MGQRATSVTGHPLILILGTAEWDAPIATNQHYVTRELAQEFDVLFVQGMGTRRPSLSRSDLRRIATRLSGRDTSATEIKRTLPDRAQIVSPTVLPIHEPFTRRLNQYLVTRSVREWLNHEGPRVLWTYTPYTYGIEATANVTVFHLVDLIHKNPGVNEQQFIAAERQLARHTDLALSTSEPIAEHLRSTGFTNVDVKHNVADVSVFANASPAPQQTDLPVVIFAGNLRNDKLDVELLSALANNLQGIAQLRLIGPSGLNGEVGWLDRLRALGVDVVPALPLHRLASEIAASKVGIIPYRITDLTLGISPLKTYEYLAAGVPVVATALPSVQANELIQVASSQSEFVRAVRERAADCDSATDERARHFALQHSWALRGAWLRTQLCDLLTANAAPA